MGDWDAADFENGLIADMRAHDGAVTTGPMAGQPLLVMTSTGARTGAQRRAILTFTRSGPDYVVAGTKSGAPTDPDWLANLRAQSAVTIEAEGRTRKATATIVDGTDRDQLWERHVAALPHFAEYPEKSGRVIPMVRLTPLDRG